MAVNPFEQQARQDQRMVGALRELLGVDNAVQTIGKSGLRDLHTIIQAVEMRLRYLEGHAVSGEAEANIDEAASMQASAAVNIARAIQCEPEEMHEIGCKCDSCRAAASDVAHDEFVDAQLLKGNHGN